MDLDPSGPVDYLYSSWRPHQPSSPGTTDATDCHHLTTCPALLINCLVRKPGSVIPYKSSESHDSRGLALNYVPDSGTPVCMRKGRVAHFSAMSRPTRLRKDLIHVLNTVHPPGLVVKWHILVGSTVFATGQRDPFWYGNRNCCAFHSYVKTYAVRMNRYTRLKHCDVSWISYNVTYVRVLC